MFKFNKQKLLFLSLIFILIFGFWLRYKNIQPANLIFDFDQYEDLFYTYTIAVDHKLAIIGRAIYGDPRLHHGVFFYYYNLLPFIISAGNPFASAYWNSFFNVATALILFILARSLFKQIVSGLIAALIAAVSFEFIKFSNWLTIDTVAISIVPLFYLGLWQFYQKKKWGLVLASASLGLAIQTDLSLIYLIPIMLIFWVILKPKFPNFKLLLVSASVFIATTSTMILTEIKLNFAGIKTLLNFSATFEVAKLPYLDRLSLFLKDFFRNFSNNLLPQRPDLGIYLAAAIILGVLYLLFANKVSKKEKYAIKFLLLYLFSPIVTLVLGYHDKPWFLIGLPPAIALIAGYAISKLKYLPLILLMVLVIGVNNVSFIVNRPLEAYKLFDSIYDSTSYLADQLAVVDYTYKESAGEPFVINAVTYPLYYNGMWAYLYSWYGKRHFGYMPSWAGGDQLYPYDLLMQPTGKEKYFYMLISETPRIPEIYKNLGRSWVYREGKLIEEKSIGGFTVQKREL